MPREAIIAALYKTFHETLPYFDQADSMQNKSYAPGKWTMRELLVHLSDCEAVYIDRLRRLAAEENPTLQAFDENKWASGLFYKKRDLTVARFQYEAARRGIIEMARTLDEKVDTNKGTHSEAGTRTFGQVLASHPEHNAHHLEQLKAIVEGRTWTKK